MYSSRFFKFFALIFGSVKVNPAICIIFVADIFSLRAATALTNTIIMNGNSYTAGIDIGGTHAAFGIVDEAGKIIGSGKLPTRSFATAEDMVKEICEALQAICKAGNVVISAVGVGAPCVNPETGCIEGAVDLPWPSPIPLRAMIEAQLGVKVAVDNDANIAAIGEMEFGAAKGLTDFIIITLGTGVGSGIVADGRLLRGRKGFAGELGHTRLRNGRGRLCGCGRMDCLDVYCSARGVVATARELLEEKKDIPSLLRDIPAEALSSKDVGEAAAKGDELAVEVLRFTGRVLGDSLADFAAFSSPQAFVIFGGVAAAGDLLLQPAREAFEENVLYIYKPGIEILRSKLNGGDAALLGAAALGRSLLHA